MLCGEKTGYAYCETTRKEDISAAVRAASAICSSGGGLGSERYLAPKGKLLGDSPLYRMKEDWEQCSRERMIGILKSAERKLRERESRTEKVIAQISNSVSRIMMYNSLGELTCETRPMGNITLSGVFCGKDPQGKKMTISKSASRSFRMGAEMLTEGIVDALVEEVLRNLDARFEAIRPKGGKMSVVMGAGASGILLHEAMGHSFEADFNRKGQSIFSDKMGKRICPEGISIVDDGTLEDNRGSIYWDDEGVRGQKTYMVENGILTSYLHDRISAAHYGVAPTGNGRRESFRCNPIPRMRATYMESGTFAPEEIISSVKNGIYVDEFSNGQVQIGEGDFTFFVNSGFLIENGRLTSPVKDINVIGNGPKALEDIRMVGRDLQISNGTWTCGKGQSVPVSVGIPTVLVENLTVGGI